MDTVKRLLSSRTVNLAILQGVAGVLAAVLVEMPELQTVGILALCKSLLDIALRIDTTKSIK